MKAIFNRNRNTVAPRVAELMVKLGVAKWVNEPEIVMTKKVVEPEKVVVPARKLTVIEQPKVPKQELKLKVKPKGKNVKAKK